MTDKLDQVIKQLNRIETNVTSLCDNISRIKVHLGLSEELDFRYGKREHGDIVNFIESCLEADVDIPAKTLWLYIERWIACNEDMHDDGLHYLGDLHFHEDKEGVTAYKKWEVETKEKWMQKIETYREMAKDKLEGNKS